MRQYVGTREQGGKLRNEVEIMSGKGYSIIFTEQQAGRLG